MPLLQYRVCASIAHSRIVTAPQEVIEKVHFLHFVMIELQAPQKNFFLIANHSQCGRTYCIWLDFAWPQNIEIRESFRTQRQKWTNKGIEGQTAAKIELGI